MVYLFEGFCGEQIGAEFSNREGAARQIQQPGQRGNKHLKITCTCINQKVHKSFVFIGFPL